jgi:hypothetical protein
MSAAIESSLPMPLRKIALTICAVAAAADHDRQAGIDRTRLAAGNRGVEEFAAPRPEVEGVAGLRQVQGQWPAHEAKTDEVDIHWMISHVDGRVGLALRGARPAG